ncbi:hypothetical protein GBW32_30050 [Streptomyces tsukubensis]|nr:hypothetical protein GBW32_30050 [Streptomyces tsukubensis]
MDPRRSPGRPSAGPAHGTRQSAALRRLRRGRGVHDAPFLPPPAAAAPPLDSGQAPARLPRGGALAPEPHLHSPARAPKPSTPGPSRPLGSKNRHPAIRHDAGKSTRRPESIAERHQLKAHKP